MFNLGGVKLLTTRTVGKAAMFLGRHKSEVLTYSGIVFSVGTTIFACKATLKMEGVLDEAKAKIDTIKDTRENLPEKYSEDDARKDQLVVTVRTVGKVAKLYAPAVAFGALSIWCIVGGHRVLRKENAAITAAYMALSESFKQYRKRVIADLGEEKNKEYYYGLKAQEIETVDENGEIQKKLTNVSVAPNVSMYARYFDETNPNWRKNPEHSLVFLRQQQQWANDKLHAKGYLFLNDVYEMLDLGCSTPGCIVGWIDGMGDSYVDFGIYDITDPESRAFVNGETQRVLLDFNVDGPIHTHFSEMADFYRGDNNDDIGRAVNQIQREKRVKRIAKGR